MRFFGDADDALVRRCQGGDKGAFETLVLRYQDHVFRQCFFLLAQNRQDAEDAAQEVLTGVWRNIKGFKFESKFSTWLYIVTRNQCLNILNRKAGSPETPMDDKLPDTPDLAGGSQKDQSTEECVRQKVNLLDENHRTVIALVHFEGCSYEEAAEVLGCPVGTVRSRLNRAFEALRPLIRECL